MKRFVVKPNISLVNSDCPFVVWDNQLNQVYAQCETIDEAIDYTQYKNRFHPVSARELNNKSLAI